MSSVKFEDNKTYKNFCTLLYPDSSDLEFFKSTVTQPVLISPLHDHDLKDSEDEEEISTEYKKPHYHLLFMTNGLKGSTINRLLDKYKCHGGEPVKNKDSYCRYLVHKDDVDKFQYRYEDIVALNTRYPYREVIEGYSKRCVQLVNEFTGYTTKYKMETGELVEKQNLLQSWQFPLYRLGEYFTCGEYTTYESKIKSWIKYRNNFTVCPPREEEPMVFFVTGSSGSGKSYFITHFLIPYLKELHPTWNECICNDRFDNYNEQEILYISELRGNDHSLSEILRLLDTTTNTPIKRRYMDVTSHFLKVVIIDTLESAGTVYKSMNKDSEFDGFRQFERRIDCTITLSYEDNINRRTITSTLNEKSNLLHQVKDISDVLTCRYNNVLPTDSMVEISEQEDLEIQSMFG